MSNDSKLITIYISQNKADILTKIPIIEALLNSAGIEYFSLNENVTNLYGGLNIVSRGIEIQVSEENVEKATELINAEPTTVSSSENSKETVSPSLSVVAILPPVGPLPELPPEIAVISGLPSPSASLGTSLASNGYAPQSSSAISDHPSPSESGHPSESLEEFPA